jgi:hypothetical protein
LQKAPLARSLTDLKIDQKMRSSRAGDYSALIAAGEIGFGF